uniref:PAT complex subunit Asterix n=7 Tax=Euteleostomi TaxID=117571 RepID=A0A8C3IIH1_CHRPI
YVPEPPPSPGPPPASSPPRSTWGEGRSVSGSHSRPRPRRFRLLGSAPLAPPALSRDPPRGAALVVGPASSPARGVRLGARLAPARRGGRGSSGTIAPGRGVLQRSAPPGSMASNSMADPRRPNKVLRYKPPSTENNPTLEDPTPDYMNLLGMIFSMCGLMLKLKWCAWIAVYCSFISFANSRSSEDTKQMMSSFMLSISAVVMSYLQNPQPMSPPW